jgi:hypothetical protein
MIKEIIMAKSARNTSGETKTAKGDVEWIDIGKTAKSETVLDALAKLQAANQAAKKARTALEDAVRGAVKPKPGFAIVFSHRFGSAWAMVPEALVETKAKAPKPETPDYGY